MKLIQRTNRNFAFILLILFPISAFILYFSLNSIISGEIDEKLRVDLLRIENELNHNPDFKSLAPIFEVQPISKNEKSSEKILNTTHFDPIEKENEPFREIQAIKQINGNWFLIIVRHSVIESQDLMFAIGMTLFIVLIFLFLTVFYLNNRFSLKLWKPFYHNIAQLKSFSIVDEGSIQLEHSTISEFNDLNNSLKILTDQLRLDYLTLKEFTENASHEIQTPLAIMTLQLEELLQNEQSEEDSKKLYACYQSARRLSRLNEKLVLLTKLDNKQFEQNQEVNLNQLIHQKREEFEGLLDERKLSVSITEQEQFIYTIDPILANMLIENLFSNIIKHATTETAVTIQIKRNAMSFVNFTETIIPSESLFLRFKKGMESSSSTGLGLSIVKSICGTSDLKCAASLLNGQFEIQIKK